MVHYSKIGSELQIIKYSQMSNVRFFNPLCSIASDFYLPSTYMQEENVQLPYGTPSTLRYTKTQITCK